MPVSRDLTMSLKIKGTEQVKGELKGVGAAAQGVGATMAGLKSSLATLGIGFAGAAIFTSAIRDAMAFETAMGEVSTITDTAAVSIDSMSASALNLSQRLGLNELDSAKALYQSISSGVRAGAESMQFLEAASKLAVGGLATTAQSVDLLTSAINAYGLSSADSTRISDIFFKTVELGKTTIPELAASLGQVMPVAQSLGVTLEELGAGVATLTIGGLSTSEAVTQLRSSMVSLLRSGKDIDELFRSKLGKGFDLNAAKAGGFAQVLRDIVTATGGNKTAILELVGRQEALNAILQIGGSQIESYDSKLKTVTDSAGATALAFEKMQTDAKRLRDTVSAVRIELAGLGAGLVATIGGFDAGSDAGARLSGVVGAIGTTIQLAMTGVQAYVGVTLRNVGYVALAAGKLMESMGLVSQETLAGIKGFADEADRQTAEAIRRASSLAEKFAVQKERALTGKFEVVGVAGAAAPMGDAAANQRVKNEQIIAGEMADQADSSKAVAASTAKAATMESLITSELQRQASIRAEQAAQRKSMNQRLADLPSEQIASAKEMISDLESGRVNDFKKLSDEQKRLFDGLGLENRFGLKEKAGAQVRQVIGLDRAQEERAKRIGAVPEIAAFGSMPKPDGLRRAGLDAPDTAQPLTSKIAATSRAVEEPRAGETTSEFLKRMAAAAAALDDVVPKLAASPEIMQRSLAHLGVGLKAAAIEPAVVPKVEARDELVSEELTEQQKSERGRQQKIRRAEFDAGRDAEVKLPKGITADLYNMAQATREVWDLVVGTKVVDERPGGPLPLPRRAHDLPPEIESRRDELDAVLPDMSIQRARQSQGSFPPADAGTDGGRKTSSVPAPRITPELNNRIEISFDPTSMAESLVKELSPIFMDVIGKIRNEVVASAHEMALERNFAMEIS